MSDQRYPPRRPNMDHFPKPTARIINDDDYQPASVSPESVEHLKRDSELVAEPIKQ
jgi:hypothetical protein